MAIRLLGLVPLLLFVGARSYLQAVGKTRPMVISMVAGNVFNFLTALLLVFGGSNLPWWTGPLRLIPALGVIGAATATTLCSVLQLVILARAVRAVQVVGHVRSSRRPDRADMTRGFWVGLPIGLQMGAEVGIFALVAVLAGRLGTDALAAHQVATTLAGFTFTVAIGIGTAGSVRVGRAVGARDIPGTRRAGLAAFAGGAGFMVFSALCFWSFPSAVARTVTDKPEVIAAVVPLLLVAAFFQLSDGIQAVGAGVLRGAGDTRFPFLANVVGHYAIGLPVAVGLGFFGGMGIIGLWWGLCAGLTAVGVALLSRFLVLSSRPIKPLGAHPEPPAFTPDGQMA
jgi:MATE family multidrug resistance protein